MKNSISILFFLNIFIILGQTPSNDPHWQIVWQDNFNTLNTNIWEVRNNFDHYSGLAGTYSSGEPQVYTNRADNIFVTNGNLVIKVRQENYICPNSALDSGGCSRQYIYGTSYNYTSGWVESKQSYNTQYGYIESRIKLPYAYGYWPAFWTIVGNGVQNQSNAAEIDIFEMLGHLPPNTITTNIHKQYPDGNIYYEEEAFSNFTYANTWHTYGIEWSPSKIIWYIDGSPIRLLANHGIIDPISIILNLAIEPGFLPPLTSFQSNMYIDYVKVYDLKNDCNTVLNACNYNFSNHDNKVKKNIIIGNGSCNNSLNPGDNVHLRASESILLNNSFTVPIGAELYIDVNPCY